MSKTVTCKICFINDNLKNEYGIPCDLDSQYHKGFTIGKGKKLYWMISWHSTGNVTVYRADNDGSDLIKRWISGDTLITIHWK